MNEGQPHAEMKSKSEIHLNTAKLVQNQTDSLLVVRAELQSALNCADATPVNVAARLEHITKDVVDRKHVLDLVLKRNLVELLKGGASCSMTSATFDRSLLIVDSAIALMRTQAVAFPLPSSLLQLFFSFCTQSELMHGIKAIRERFEALRAATPNSSSVWTIKAALSCINRNHNGSNPELAGRLRLMLAAALPVWHPSGMNRRGQVNANEINYENVVRLEDLGAADDDGKPSTGIDVALYNAFWGVQSYMLKPSLAESPPHWNKASAAMKKVLSAFETLPCSTTTENPPRDAIPKYLTSPSILRLQLVDLQVRRHILMQYMIFLHHLEVVGGAPPTPKDTPATAKSAKFCNSLFSAGGEGEQLRNRVHDLLERDSSGKYKRFIISLLHREKRWIEWKKKGYKHLFESGSGTPKTFKRRLVLSPLDQAHTPPPTRPRTSFGAADWKSRQDAWKILSPQERMDALKDPHRNPVPSLQELLGEVVEDMKDEDIDEDSKRKNDPKYVWRSLRVLCADSVDMLSKAIDEKSKLGYDLERCVGPVPDGKQGSSEVITSEPGEIPT